MPTGYWTTGTDNLITGTVTGGKTGTSVSVSGNGEIIAVSSIYYPIPGKDRAGKVDVYNISTKLQIGSSIFGDAAYQFMGLNVALNYNGSVVAMSSNNGATKIYKLVNNDWMIKGGVLGTGTTSSVDINDDGSVVIVGGRFTNGNGDKGGRAFVCTFSNNSWVARGQTILGTAANQNLGISVSINGVGDLIAVGVPGRGPYGQVEVYSFSNNTWNLVKTAVSGTQTPERFGESVKISKASTVDNINLAVGAPLFNGQYLRTGKVYFYNSVSSQTEWTNQGSFIGTTLNEYNGTSVTLSANGDLAVVGSPKLQGSTDGKIFIYRKTNGMMLLEETLEGSFVNSHFGCWVSCSDDGKVIIVGADSANVNNIEVGGAQYFKQISYLIATIGSGIPTTGSYYYIDNSIGYIYNNQQLINGVRLNKSFLSTDIVIFGDNTPTNEMGNNGNYFVDLIGKNFYGPKTTGFWGTGTSIVFNNTSNGEGIPSSSRGNNGDYYMDIITKKLYGPKKSDQWGPPITTIPGYMSYSSLLYGNGVPSNYDGFVGDYYIDINVDADVNKIFGPKISTGWPTSSKILPNLVKIISGSVSPYAYAVGEIGDLFYNIDSLYLSMPKNYYGWLFRRQANEININASSPFLNILILSSIGIPSSDMGNSGSYYIDIETYDIKLYTKGTNGWNNGVLLLQPYAIKGNNDPSNDEGINGQYYLNLNSNKYYGPKNNNTWNLSTFKILNIPARGLENGIILRGSTKPPFITMGETSDYYISNDGTLFGPKTNVWGVGVPPLEDGTVLLGGKYAIKGHGAPESVVGSNENFYINLDNRLVYGPKFEGSWEVRSPFYLPASVDIDADFLADITRPNNIGKSGDYFINLAENAIYGPLGSALDWDFSVFKSFLRPAILINGSLPNIAIVNDYCFDTIGKLLYGPYNQLWPTDRRPTFLNFPVTKTTTIFMGKVPNNNEGSKGDFVIDFINGEFSGPKIGKDDYWTNITPFGKQAIFGSLPPTNTTGILNDFYVRYGKTAEFYGHKTINQGWNYRKFITFPLPNITLAKFILVGRGPPKIYEGKLDDIFVDLSSGSIYIRQKSAWAILTVKINIVSFIGESPIPDSSDPYLISGSYYLDTTNKLIKGPSPSNVTACKASIVDVYPRIIIGEGVPDFRIIAVDGDYYFDKLANILYGPRKNSIWDFLEKKSAIIENGSPDANQGNAGDYYISLNNGEIYLKSK